MRGGEGKLEGGIIHRTSSLKTASEIAEKEGQFNTGENRNVHRE